MRKNLAIILISTCSVCCFGQSNNLNSRQIKSLTTLGELWGFLKYYHPTVARGHWDWDSVLISKIPLYLKAKDKETVSFLTYSWILELGKIDSCKKCNINVPDSVSYNLDFSWVNEHTFTKEVISHLKYIRSNRNIELHCYVEYDKIRRTVNFIHEKIYNQPKFLYPGAEYRLLLLFRYWNIVNYFSPYKYLNGSDWKKVLEESIVAFYRATDTLSYQLEYIKLINSLNDGHSVVHGAALESILGKFYSIPFLCMLIDNQFVVSFISNDSAASNIRIKKGDVIKEVNGENIIKRFKRLSPYVIASNDDNRAMDFAASFLFRGKDSLFIIKKVRAGKMTTDTLQLFQKIIPEVFAEKPWIVKMDSIGYVDMGALKKEQVHIMMQELMHTKGIIFDIRNYPNNTWDLIATYLCKNPFIMSKITYPNLNYPGVFLYRKSTLYGKTNKKPYAGKVVLLVDESSVSHAEYSAMGLQAATQTITIGNTTAGKIGDITNRFWLPGGLFSRFSGFGVYYPDGTVTQRKGVKVDIKVRPTIKGLQEGRDEVMERALNYILSHK